MKSNRRKFISAFVVTIAVFAVASAAAEAVSTPVWYTRAAGAKKQSKGEPLTTGQSMETILTGGAISVNFEYIGGALEVNCQKSSGTGSVIGGEPGKAKLTLSFSECKGSPSNCENASLLKLENIEGELVLLKDGKTITEELKMPSTKEPKFLKVEDPLKCHVPSQTYEIYNNLPGLVGTGETLEFPKTPVEGFSLEWGAQFHVLSFTDNLTQKLVNGRTLFADLEPA